MTDRTRYAGKWVAWSIDGKRIVAWADTLESLWRIIWEKKEDVTYELIPEHLEPVEGQ
jgi:hypothetical protein